MQYQHCSTDGQPINLPAGKAVCVGRIYAEHARELNNPVPSQPLLFIKPNTAMVPMEAPLVLPQGRGDVHYEAELVLLIGQPLCQATAADVKAAIAGVGLGLDLTLRGLQQTLKDKGHPWEIAKAFDGSCPLSAFVDPAQIRDLGQTDYRLYINDELRQHGQTRMMLTPIYELVAYCSQYFTLLPGDVVLTGSPAGVGVINRGDRLRLTLADQFEVKTQVAS